MAVLDDQFKQWADWFAEISEEVEFLLRSAETFWQIQTFINENSQKLDPVVWHWFNAWTASNWSTATAARIRALGDPNRNTRSLHSLLQRVGDNPTVFSRTRYVALTHASDSYSVERSHKEFDEMAGRGEHLDPNVVAKDISEIETALAGVKDYVDRRVAHLDKDWKNKKIQGNRLNLALDVLRKISEKYTLLFTGMPASAHFGRLISSDVREVFKTRPGTGPGTGK